VENSADFSREQFPRSILRGNNDDVDTTAYSGISYSDVFTSFKSLGPGPALSCAYSDAFSSLKSLVSLEGLKFLDKDDAANTDDDTITGTKFDNKSDKLDGNNGGGEEGDLEMKILASTGKLLVEQKKGRNFQNQCHRKSSEDTDMSSNNEASVGFMTKARKEK